MQPPWLQVCAVRQRLAGVGSGALTPLPQALGGVELAVYGLSAREALREAWLRMLGASTVAAADSAIEAALQRHAWPQGPHAMPLQALHEVFDFLCQALLLPAPWLPAPC